MFFFKNFILVINQTQNTKHKKKDNNNIDYEKTKKKKHKPVMDSDIQSPLELLLIGHGGVKV